MYAIFQIFYGIPLTGHHDEFEDEFEASNCGGGTGSGFEEWYSGSADEIPCAFGIEIGGFDEASDAIDVSTLPLNPTAHHMAEFWRMFNALDPAVQAKVSKYGSPKVYFIPTTS